MKRFLELDDDVERELEALGSGFAPASEEEASSVKRLKRAEVVEAFAMGADRLCTEQAEEIQALRRRVEAMSGVLRRLPEAVICTFCDQALQRAPDEMEPAEVV